jgi:hypothetical protein
MPTQYTQPTDEQIRTRAYYLWEADGRPQSRDWDYWMKAKQQLEREFSASNGGSRKTASSPAEKPEKPEKPAAKRNRAPAYA